MPAPDSDRRFEKADILSTKIHNGILFRGSLRGVYERLRQSRPHIHEMQKRETLAFLGRRAAEILDRRVLGMHPLKDEHGQKSPLSAAWREMRDRQAEIVRSGYRDPEVDFGFSIVLLPAQRVFGLVDAEQKSFRDWLMSQDWLQEFNYWDNTDRPDSLSEAQWEHRRGIWKELLSPKGAGWPGDWGLGFTCNPPPMTLEAALVAAAAPPIEKRARDLAKMRLVDVYVRARRETASPETLDMTALTGLVHEAAGWMMSAKDGRQALDEETRKLAGILPELNEDILTSVQAEAGIPAAAMEGDAGPGI